MAERAILLTPPKGHGLSDVVALASDAASPLVALMQEELQRYPADHALPKLLFVRSATQGGAAVRARYLEDCDLCVLTPTFDLRGNTHRVIAAALLAANAAAAADLRQGWASDSSARLYGGRLDDEAEIVAMIAAVVQNRATLGRAALLMPRLDRRVKLAGSFLAAIGLADRSRAEAAPHGYLSSIVGGFPDYVIEPGSVALELAPPPAPVGKDHTFITVRRTDAPLVIDGVRTDVWILPEPLLGESTKRICIVEDVRHPRHDIAGFASGASGSSSTVVVERTHRRGIFFHELGHAIHHRYDALFPDTEWAVVAGAGCYFGDARKFIELGIHNDDYDPDLLDRGFITSYSSAAKQEDVAELTQAILAGDDRLWECLAGAPLVAQKVSLILGFLEAVHPVLTEQYLRQLSTERLDQEAMWGTK